MFLRFVIQTTLWLAFLAALLFLSAGDWRWPQAWIFLLETGGFSFAICGWLAHHDPDLLAQRLTSPVQRDQQPWDRVFMAVTSVAFVAWLVLIALDARRFGWSAVPAWGQALGALAIALCMVLVWQTFRWNTFAVPQARMQGGRGHRVIREGPYRFVRHPMYAGAILFYLGTPLLLRSLWGLVAVPILTAAMGGRAIGEERMLRRELEGYDEYARQVRWRLVPGLW